MISLLFLFEMIQHMNRQHSLPSVHSREVSSYSLMKKQKTNILSRLGYEERKWLEKRGKNESVVFTAQMLDKLRRYFDDLDTDKSGAIGLSELEDPLIILQFCSSKQEVKNLINTIDLDGSGEVDFGEFLQIFRKFKLNKYANPKEAEKYHKFMEMFNNEKSSKHFGKENSYRMALSELRRKKLISELTNPQIIEPRVKRYQKRREIVPNFIKKIENQFMETPELNSKLMQFRQQNYFKVKLGKNYNCIKRKLY